MTWFRVDDRLPDHRKVRKAGTSAMGLWLLAGAWSAGNLTDGWVPRDVALRYGTERQAQRLVAAELWRADVVDGNDGWWFHQWTEHQPTRAQVQQKRKAATERQQRWRDGSKENPGAKSSDLPGVSHRNFAEDHASENFPVSNENTGQGSMSRVYKGVSHGVSHAAPDPTRPDKEHGDSGGLVPVGTAHERGASGPNSTPAYRLVDEVIGRHVPSSIRTALAIEVVKLWPEATPDELREALGRWDNRTGIGAALLPGLLADIRKERRGATSRASPVGPAISPTDQHIAQLLASVNDTPNLRALPGGAT